MVLGPRDPHFERRTRENFSSQGFMRFPGTEITAVGPGMCKLRLTFRDALAKQDGYFYGGVVATMADVCGGYAAFSLLPPDRTNVTVEFELSLVAPECDLPKADVDPERVRQHVTQA
jgi:acyl-coenzyme A thioesterase PaaI-like protein